MGLKSKIPVLTVYDENGNRIPIPAIAGKSAYEYAKDGGYTGTEAEFAQKLASEFTGAIELDTTLAESGKAADAKAVGDALAAKAKQPLELYAVGSITSASLLISDKSESTGDDYTILELYKEAQDRQVTLRIMVTRSTSSVRSGLFLYSPVYKKAGESIEYLEFFGHYKDFDGKWVPAVAKITKNATTKALYATITDLDWAGGDSQSDAAPPLRLFAAGVDITGNLGSDLRPINISTINESTNAPYTAEEISELANTRYVVLNTTLATMYGNIDGTFRYYRTVQTNGELDYVEFTGHYVDLSGKWIPATAKVGTDNIVVIEDETWEGSGGTITPGIENAGKLLYVDESGNGAFLQLGDGLEIRNGRLCIVGTVTPDEPAEAIAFEQTGENSVAVSGVVFEQQADGTVLWRGATFTPGEENSVIIS